MILKSVGARKLEPDVFYKTKQRMNMDIKSLMNNPYAWVILSVCTILSFVFGVYTWFAGEYSCAMKSHFRKFGNQREYPKVCVNLQTDVR